MGGYLVMDMKYLEELKLTVVPWVLCFKLPWWWRDSEPLCWSCLSICHISPQFNTSFLLHVKDCVRIGLSHCWVLKTNAKGSLNYPHPLIFWCFNLPTSSEFSSTASNIQVVGFFLKLYSRQRNQGHGYVWEQLWLCSSFLQRSKETKSCIFI